MHLFLATLFLLLVSNLAFGCSCVPQPKDIELAVKQAIESSDSVVLAKAVKVAPLHYYRDSPQTPENVLSERTHFSEILSWKGDHGKQFYTEIITACCMCGVSFAEGEVYLLYLRKDTENGSYVASSCGRSDLKAYAEDDIRYLNREEPNNSKQQGPSAGTRKRRAPHIEAL